MQAYQGEKLVDAASDLSMKEVGDRLKDLFAKDENHRPDRVTIAEFKPGEKVELKGLIFKVDQIDTKKGMLKLKMMRPNQSEA